MEGDLVKTPVHAPVKKHGGSREGTGPKLQHQKDVADEAKFPRLWSWLGQSGSGGDGSATKRPRTVDTDGKVANKTQATPQDPKQNSPSTSETSYFAGSVLGKTGIVSQAITLIRSGNDCLPYSISCL